MFEQFTVNNLAERAGWDITVLENGWKNPFAIPTAEAIVWRKKGDGFLPQDLEFAVARRVAGAPECLGMWQLKWGTVIFPADETPVVALMRCMAKDLGLRFLQNIMPIGTVGPWLYRSTIALNNEQLVLTVLDEQAEKETPFYASLFYVDATGLAQGQVSSAVVDFEWVGFEDLIARYGANTNCIYWQMFFMVMEQFLEKPKTENFFARTWRPGEYVLKMPEQKSYYVPDAEWER